MLGNASVGDTTTQVAIITTLGLIVVALIGVLTAKITSSATKDAQVNAEEASKSAQVAKDYAAAIVAKDVLISSLEARIGFLEEHEKNCSARLQELELRVEENEEQRRAASIIEREQQREISQLRSEILSLQKKR